MSNFTRDGWWFEGGAPGRRLSGVSGPSAPGDSLVGGGTSKVEETGKPAPSGGGNRGQRRSAGTTAQTKAGGAPTPPLSLSDDITATAKRYGLRLTGADQGAGADDFGPLGTSWKGSAQGMAGFYRELQGRHGGQLVKLLHNTPAHRDHVYVGRPIQGKARVQGFLDRRIGRPPKQPGLWNVKPAPTVGEYVQGLGLTSQAVQQAKLTPEGWEAARRKQLNDRFAGPRTWNPMTWDVHRPRTQGELWSAYVEGAIFPLRQGALQGQNAAYSEREKSGKVAAPPQLAADPGQRTQQLAEISGVRSAYVDYVSKLYRQLERDFRLAETEHDRKYSRPYYSAEEKRARREAWDLTAAGVVRRFEQGLRHGEVANAVERTTGKRLTRLQREALASAADFNFFEYLSKPDIAAATTEDLLISLVADRLGAGVAGKIVRSSGLKGPGARVTGGAIEGSVAGSVQQPTAAYLQGQRDPAGLAQESALGLLFGGLGGAAVGGAPSAPGKARQLGRLGGKSIGAAANAKGLVHLTDEGSAFQIMKTGELRGAKGIFAVPAEVAKEAVPLKVARTGVMPKKTKHAVPIPDAALDLFQRPVPLGPYSAWKYFGGVRYAPAGKINMSTGGFSKGTGLVGPKVLIYGPDGIVYVGIATGAGLYIYAQTAGVE